jgi:hypothetical protein
MSPTLRGDEPGEPPPATPNAKNPPNLSPNRNAVDPIELLSTFHHYIHEVLEGSVPNRCLTCIILFPAVQAGDGSPERAPPALAAQNGSPAFAAVVGSLLTRPYSPKLQIYKAHLPQASPPASQQAPHLLPRRVADLLEASPWLRHRSLLRRRRLPSMPWQPPFSPRELPPPTHLGSCCPGYSSADPPPPLQTPSRHWWRMLPTRGRPLGSRGCHLPLVASGCVIPRHQAPWWMHAGLLLPPPPPSNHVVQLTQGLPQRRQISSVIVLTVLVAGMWHRSVPIHPVACAAGSRATELSTASSLEHFEKPGGPRL